MAWHPGFEAYQFFMQGRTLPVRMLGPRIDGDFIALYAEIDTCWLPRPNSTRGWDLHVSLGFMSEYRSRGVAEDAVLELIRILDQRWSDTCHMLTVEWVGNGAALMIDGDDPLSLDPVVDYLAKHGGYERQLHIST
jgi:hypothetical protein